mgnify:CR=1 FL=1
MNHWLGSSLLISIAMLLTGIQPAESLKAPIMLVAPEPPVKPHSPGQPSWQSCCPLILLENFLRWQVSPDLLVKLDLNTEVDLEPKLWGHEVRNG